MMIFLFSFTITLFILALALSGAGGRSKNRDDKEKIYTDTMIDLAERQFAAREAMGEKHMLHPSKSVKRNEPKLRLIKG